MRGRDEDNEDEESQSLIDKQAPSQTESQPHVSPQTESQPHVSPQIESQPQVSPQTESQPHVSPQIESQPQVSPQIETFAVSEKKMPHTRQTTGKKIDWEAINAHNQQIGAEGEEIVVNLEKQHLRERGKHDLSHRVRNIAKEHGDGFGYDVLSYFPSGKKKYIEVKSSSNNFSSGFIMTHNEVEFCKQNLEVSYIYCITIPFISPSESLKIISSNDLFRTKKFTPTKYTVTYRI